MYVLSSLLSSRFGESREQKSVQELSKELAIMQVPETALALFLFKQY
jgi:hypothetical protein